MTQPNLTPISTVTMSMRMATALFEGEKFDAATLVSKNESGEPVAAFDLSANKKVAVNVAVKTEHPMTQNIVAVWEGSDSVLKNEYVAVGAHYDHIGVAGSGQCQALNGDTICIHKRKMRSEN